MEFGFIGAGKMAGAIIRGMLKSGSSKSADIACVCGDDDTAQNLSKETSIAVMPSAKELFDSCQTLVLACKPQQLSEIAEALSGVEKPIKLLVSILAGTSIKRLRQVFPNAENIVRIMPNMPAQISEGISCYCSESPLSDAAFSSLKKILDAMGESVELPENKLDAVTALSGSGPGYVFEFASALLEAAQKLGFSSDEAKKLTYKTLLGSVKLLCSSELSADELRNAVSSKGGTTLAGLSKFDEAGFRKTVQNALDAAKKRSEELSKL